MKKIKVGVVGVGYFGQFHAEKYAELKGVELVGVVDINTSRAREIAGLEVHPFGAPRVPHQGPVESLGRPCQLQARGCAGETTPEHARMATVWQERWIRH